MKNQGKLAQSVSSASVSMIIKAIRRTGVYWWLYRFAHVSYQEILSGKGYGLEAPRQAIQIVHNIRHATPIGAKGEYHPFVKKPLSKHPFEH